MKKRETMGNLATIPSKATEAYTIIGGACVYAIGPMRGQPLKIGYSRNVFKRFEQLQMGYWEELQIHHVAWTVGELIALKLEAETHRLLNAAKLRLRSEWFNVSVELAVQTINLSAKNLDIQTHTHAKMMAECLKLTDKRNEKWRQAYTTPTYKGALYNGA